jgi:hypothetical protein
MLDFTQKIIELKEANSDLTNFKLKFNETTLFLGGELVDENGKKLGEYGAGVVAYFYIPTDKGYISTEWKKSKFWKMKGEEITDELLYELEPYLQYKEETKFIKQTGCSVASAIADHINRTGGDIYCNG